MKNKVLKTFEEGPKSGGRDDMKQMRSSTYEDIGFGVSTVESFGVAKDFVSEDIIMKSFNIHGGIG